MRSIAITVLIATAALTAASCQSNPVAPVSMAAGIRDAVIPLGAYPFAPSTLNRAAVVTGCTWTNELGQVIGGWGKRQAGSGAAFPNPTTGSVAMNFGLPLDGEVVWWLEKAYGPGEEIPDLSGQYVGATYREPTRTLAGPFREFVAAGVHYLGWDGEDAMGMLVPDGYYRMYVQFPSRNWTGWWDILVLHD